MKKATESTEWMIHDPFSPVKKVSKAVVGGFAAPDGDRRDAATVHQKAQDAPGGGDRSVPAGAAQQHGDLALPHIGYWPRRASTWRTSAELAAGVVAWTGVRRAVANDTRLIGARRRPAPPARRTARGRGRAASGSGRPDAPE